MIIFDNDHFYFIFAEYWIYSFIYIQNTQLYNNKDNIYMLVGRSEVFLCLFK